jgi:class 3 adenylate cyclase/tetratricopeptide (TPR) repeat protein
VALVVVCQACGHENPTPFRFCPECGAPSSAPSPSREERKVVTVVFCDVTGSTELGESLDPEALRGLLARYFERMRQIVENHGGTVEKFIGDAVMAVFGIPVLHEDDALRACRAATEMRAALPDLGIRGRIGVATGEVVTGTEERLATGDAVNLAARLEQAAAPGVVLISEATHTLVRQVVDVEVREPLALKGKTRPVAAFELHGVHAGDRERRFTTPLVGRERERRVLPDLFARVRDDQACQLVTILGAAGVGKSRLAAEFLAELGDAARVVRGRCLSYGEGITYWPIVEVLKQLDHRPAGEAAQTAIDSLLGNNAEVVAAGEIAWGVRKTLEDAARESPLVCVLDDLHWAEPLLLDLVEHVADMSRDAPILLLCMARPELLDRRPSWAGGKLNATSMLLEPLSPERTEELIESLGHLHPTVRQRIRDAADGNPLFVEEMLGLIRETGSQDVAVPASINALLAARLDQLDPAERVVLQRGAVEGKVFHRAVVAELSPEEPNLDGRLVRLVRTELVRPDIPVFAGDDAFRHLLIRDAAYDALPKAARVELHERFADWLEVHGGELVELDEIIGYHLEQALRYRKELGLPRPSELSGRARTRLEAAGRRAARRADTPAAAKLFGRAITLLAPGTIDLALDVQHMESVFYLGQLTEARTLAHDLIRRAQAADDRVAELVGEIKDLAYGLLMETEGATARLLQAIDLALPELERAADHIGLYVAYSARANAQNMAALHDAQRDSLTEAWCHGELSGVPGFADQLIGELGDSRLFGSTPVTELLAFLDQQEETYGDHVAVRAQRAVGLAMLGRFDEARSLIAQTLDHLRDRGSMFPFGFISSQLAAQIHALAGDHEAALSLGEEGCRILDAAGERGMLSTGLCYVARNLYALGRFEEAEAAADRAMTIGASDDFVTQIMSQGVKAKLLAHRGEDTSSQERAEAAVSMAERTQQLHTQADAYADLADVLLLLGSDTQAITAYQEAIQRYQRKGDTVSAARVNGALERLVGASP